ncbi:MAG: hypothetical protein O2894_10080 [Planctomycetota bacterium]|nr:hypothetical protein [Planctomycetota bacterium]
MNPIVWTYTIYLVISIALTIWVARTLHRNGRHFLVEVYRGNESLADSVNHLLVVGFYLVNLGYITLALAVSRYVHDTRGAIETVSAKVGAVLIVLGIMHFTNLFVFTRMRRRAELRSAPPPLPPTSRLAPIAPVR